MSRRRSRISTTAGRSLRRRERQQLSRRLQVIVSPDEYTDIVAAARSAGVSVSRWVAEVAVGEARRNAVAGRSSGS
ncbi:MAG: plasmid mobilization protein [Terriglobia bacterium]